MHYRLVAGSNKYELEWKYINNSTNVCYGSGRDEPNWQNEENRNGDWLEIIDNWWHQWRAYKEIEMYTARK